MPSLTISNLQLTRSPGLDGVPVVALESVSDVGSLPVGRITEGAPALGIPEPTLATGGRERDRCLGLDEKFQLQEGRAPRVETGAARAITATTAKLEGRINPLGTPTYYYFQYGTDTSYSDTPFQNPYRANVHAKRHQDTSSGIIYLPVPGIYEGLRITPLTVLVNLEGLKPATTYHYRLVAHSRFGPTFGEDTVLITASE